MPTAIPWRDVNTADKDGERTILQDVVNGVKGRQTFDTWRLNHFTSGQPGLEFKAGGVYAVADVAGFPAVTQKVLTGLAGMHVYWDGTEAAIPKGWALSNAAWDGMYVVKASSAQTPGTFIGNAAITNTINLSHTHTHNHQHRAPDHNHDIHHTHTLSSHTHDIDHNHPLSAAVATATPPEVDAGTPVSLTAGASSYGLSTTLHQHKVDLPALGTTASGVPSSNTTGAVTGSAYSSPGPMSDVNNASPLDTTAFVSPATSATTIEVPAVTPPSDFTAVSIAPRSVVLRMIRFNG